MIIINENKLSWKKSLLADHPRCIFCAGDSPSEEADHQPPRQIFRNRIGPEGFAFPACSRCNRQTSNEEIFVSTLATISPQEESKVIDDEVKKRLNNLSSINSSILPSMIPRANQVRSAARKLGIQKQLGETWRDVWRKLRLINIPENFHESLRNVTGKLFLALHWRHTGKIVDRNGGVLIKYFSNYQIRVKDYPVALTKVIEVCDLIPPILRARRDLSDQFFYRTTTAEISPRTYVAFFPESIVVIGGVYEDLSDIESEDLKNGPVFRPYKWKDISSTT